MLAKSSYRIVDQVGTPGIMKDGCSAIQDNEEIKNFRVKVVSGTSRLFRFIDNNYCRLFLLIARCADPVRTPAGLPVQSAGITKQILSPRCL